MNNPLIFSGRQDIWHGYTRQILDFGGIGAYLVQPARTAEARPWIWRVRFFGEWPNVDLTLLAKGFHVAHIDVADLFGGPEALRRMDMLYTHLTQEVKLSPKVVLEGFSRGGLAAYRWAARNPEKIHSIYADAPVCDINSWPGGKGIGTGSPEDWAKCLKAHGLTEKTVDAFTGNPIDNLQPLVDAGIPVIHVCGDVDEVVPVAENSTILVARYRKLGGEAWVVMKPGVGHHPHSLEDPEEIVDFIVSSCERT